LRFRSSTKTPLYRQQVKALPFENGAIIAEALSLLKKEGPEGITFCKLTSRLGIKDEGNQAQERTPFT
jgi:hypothetical protein